MKEKIEKAKAGEVKKKVVETKCLARGRKFEGYVINKFDKRVVIRFERVKFIRKYERYSKTWTKIHAYLPEELKDEINVGDYIQVRECRPLSKILHHIVVKKIRGVNDKKGKEEKSGGSFK